MRSSIPARRPVTVAGPTRLLPLVLVAALTAACSGGRGGPNLPDLASAGASPAPVATVAASTTPSVLPAASPSDAPVATATPTPTKVPGTGKITDKANGFAITLPAGWREIPLDGSETAEIESELPAGSQLGATLEATTSSAAAKGFAMFAMDLSADTLAAATFSGLEVQVAEPTSLPLSLLESLVIGLLQEAPGVTNVSGKIVTLPAGQAIRVTYTLVTTTSSGQSVKLAGTDYVLVSSKHTYTVTFLVSYAAASDGRADAGTIMKTFDIL
jgi:hypothetical protein